MKKLIYFVFCFLTFYQCLNDRTKVKVQLNPKTELQNQVRFDNSSTTIYPPSYEYSQKDSILFFSVEGQAELSRKRDFILKEFYELKPKVDVFTANIFRQMKEKEGIASYRDLVEVMGSNERSLFKNLDEELFDVYVKIMFGNASHTISLSETEKLRFSRTKKIVFQHSFLENGDTTFCPISNVSVSKNYVENDTLNLMTVAFVSCEIDTAKYLTIVLGIEIKEEDLMK